MELKIDHINLTISNWEETLNWYQKVFGFELIEEGARTSPLTGNPQRWGIIQRNSAYLCFAEYPELKGNQIETGVNGKNRINHFGLRINDKEAFEEKVRAYNLKVMYGGPVKYPRSISWYVEDPNGHEIEVSYWG